MYRIKNFLTMKVLYSSARKIGSINDLALNFKENKVAGFLVAGGNLIHRKNRVIFTEDIIYYNRNMIVSKLSERNQLTFSKIRGMEVIDICGNIIGVVDDILFDQKFCLKGIIISPGTIKKFLKGKRILLIQEVVFGDENILYYGKDKYRFISERHSISSEDCYEQKP